VQFCKIFFRILTSDAPEEGRFLQHDQPNANCQLCLIWDFYLNDPGFLFLAASSLPAAPVSA
jgi:hypothetical protein